MRFLIRVFLWLKDLKNTSQRLYGIYYLLKLDIDLLTYSMLAVWYIFIRYNGSTSKFTVF